MSLKNVKRPRYKSWSIATRFTLLCTILACGLLLLSSGFFYWILASNLRRDEHQFLFDKVQVLRAILKEHPGETEPLEEELQWEGYARRSSKYYSRILDEGGHLLMETSDMGDIVSITEFPTPIGAQEIPDEAGVKWRELRANGRTYLLISALAELGTSGEHPRIIQVALEMTYEETLLSNYRRKLAFALVLGVLLSGVAGTLIARRGMRPLNEIVQTAKRITAHQLHERISPIRWPKELTDLATTFDEMLQRLEDSFKRLQQFSADLAHELRTPINNLTGEAEVALSRTRTSDEYAQVLESSLEEYRRLSSMIESLLFLARSEGAETQIERTLIDARQGMEAVQEFYDAVAEEQKVRVACHGNEHLYADPILFRRAVSNLLSNALQYTPPGGRIDLEVRSSDHRSVDVIVCDTGVGIDTKDLPKIFDRFYRGDHFKSQVVSQDHHPGTGLGLAIVKSIMDLHGGRVTVESELNKGTKITLKFSHPDPNQDDQIVIQESSSHQLSHSKEIQ
jgi:two-component system heavy metal sensor histidine kinase CusS